MKKLTILSVIALVALTLGMMTPNFSLLADATNNNNNNNNYNDTHDDDCDYSDDHKKRYGGSHSDDCDDDNDDDNKGKNKPTINVYKVVINNQGNPVPTISSFGVKLNDASVTVNGTSFTVKPNKPVTLTETGLAGYEFVEIRGDGHCPENLGGTITLNKGQNIKCYIVNQPEGTAGPIEPGVIFHFNTLTFDAGNKLTAQSCSVPGMSLPCVELANVDETNSLLVVDTELQTDTTIVLFSVVEADKVSNGMSAQSPLCVFSGMKQHVLGYANNPTDFPVDRPTDQLGFEVNCSLIEPVKYKFSYALIETDRG